MSSDSWQCRIYIPCSLSLRLLGSHGGSLGTFGLTQKLCLKKTDENESMAEVNWKQLFNPACKHQKSFDTRAETENFNCVNSCFIAKLVLHTSESKNEQCIPLYMSWNEKHFIYFVNISCLFSFADKIKNLGIQ